MIFKSKPVLLLLRWRRSQKVQGNGAHPFDSISWPLGQPTQPPRMPPHFHPVNNSLINRAAITACQAKIMGVFLPRTQKGRGTHAAGCNAGDMVFLQSLLLIRATAFTSQLITADTNTGHAWVTEGVSSFDAFIHFNFRVTKLTHTPSLAPSCYTPLLHSCLLISSAL